MSVDTTRAPKSRSAPLQIGQRWPELPVLCVGQNQMKLDYLRNVYLQNIRFMMMMMWLISN